MAAARLAVSFQPEEWRYYYRLASISWGTERLQAAIMAQRRRPELTVLVLLMVEVLVAQGLWSDALDCLVPGCLLEDSQRRTAGGFSTPGLHLLNGRLLLAARGDAEGARREWSRELDMEDRGHVHGREVCADTWYTIGALALRERRLDEAAAAFQRALTRVPGHGLAAVGLHAALGQELQIPVHGGGAMDRAMVQAAILALQGKHREASGVCTEALRDAEWPSDGWMLALDPLLDVASHREEWAEPLRILEEYAR
jgi:tetratricopeptide (TPR) repeat protein